MFGDERDALGLAGLDRQCVQPKRLPAVIEPVQQPEMMSMKVEHSRDIGAIGEGQYHGAAGFGMEGGRSRVGEARRPHPIGLRSAERPSPERQIDPQGVLQVELRREVGRMPSSI